MEPWRSSAVMVSGFWMFWAHPTRDLRHFLCLWMPHGSACVSGTALGYAWMIAKVLAPKVSKLLLEEVSNPYPASLSHCHYSHHMSL